MQKGKTIIRDADSGILAVIKFMCKKKCGITIQDQSPERSPPNPMTYLTTRTTFLRHSPFKENSGLKFRKFHVPNETVHSGCTNLTQTTAVLVIVPVSRIQKSGTGDNNFLKWKGTFQSNLPR